MNPTDAVWYACYGSNLLSDRFLCYLDGQKRSFYGVTLRSQGCKNKSLWTDSATELFPGRLYYAKYSRTWGGGVAFFDPEACGTVRMRLYRITWEQFCSLQAQECGSSDWYSRSVLLGVGKDGAPVYTVTSPERYPSRAPSEAYRNVIRDGLLECGLSPAQADAYLLTTLPS